MTTEKIPAIVLALAARVKMNPIAWKEYPDRIVIVFQEGPKLSFERDLANQLTEDIKTIARTTTATQAVTKVQAGKPAATPASRGANHFPPPTEVLPPKSPPPAPPRRSSRK